MKTTKELNALIQAAKVNAGITDTRDGWERNFTNYITEDLSEAAVSMLTDADEDDREELTALCDLLDELKEAEEIELTRACVGTLLADSADNAELNADKPARSASVILEEDGVARYMVKNAAGDMQGVLRSNDPKKVAEWFSTNFPGVEIPFTGTRTFKYTNLEHTMNKFGRGVKEVKWLLIEPQPDPEDERDHGFYLTVPGEDFQNLERALAEKFPAVKINLIPICGLRELMNKDEKKLARCGFVKHTHHDGREVYCRQGDGNEYTKEQALCFNY